jgi:hypothetical protein
MPSVASEKWSPNAASSPVQTPSTEGYDRVAEYLFYHDLVPFEPLVSEWYQWQREGGHGKFWRFLLMNPRIDAEVVLAAAAYVYGFRSIRLDTEESGYLIQELYRQYPPGHWIKMIRMGLLPAVELGNRSQTERMVVASLDPSSRVVAPFLRALRLDTVEVCHASLWHLRALVAQCFPEQQLHTGCDLEPVGFVSVVRTQPPQSFYGS